MAIEIKDLLSSEIEKININDFMNIPLIKGDKGEQGIQGIQGEKGDKGDTPQKGTDYFTPEEIQEIKSNILDQVNQFSILVVSELPTENIDDHTIYFVPKTKTEQNDVYDEFIYINNGWEHIGTTEVDLSSYYKKDEIDKKLSEVEGNEVYIGKAEEAPSSAKIIVEEEDFGEGAGLSKSEVYVGADEPTTGEKVWLKKGKNIVESSLNSVNSYGVTANNNADGSVSVSGTSTAQIAYLINVKRIYASNIKNGMYTISFKNNKVVSALGIRLRKCSSSAKTEIYTTLLDKVNKSEKVNLQSLIDSDTLYIEMDIVLYKATDYDVKIYPQIEPGDETSYETYIEPQIYVRNSNGAYEEFINKKELEKEIFVNKAPFTANEGYTIDLQYMNKQGKHYWGTVVFHKNSGMFGSSEIALKCNVELAQIFSYGCFLGTNTYNALAVGYLHLRANQELYVGDNNNTSKYNYARCFVDFIEK